MLLVPGCAFMPDPEAPCSYVRASYSLASEEQIDQVSVCVCAGVCVCMCVSILLYLITFICCPSYLAITTATLLTCFYHLLIIVIIYFWHLHLYDRCHSRCHCHNAMVFPAHRRFHYEHRNINNLLPTVNITSHISQLKVEQRQCSTC